MCVGEESGWLRFSRRFRIRDWLEDQGHRVNRKKVRRLMRTMDLTAQYPKRNLSLANQAHKVYPYLLRDLVIDRPKHVWATDVTYIPMARGFVYLVAIMDGCSRKVLSCGCPTRSMPASVCRRSRRRWRPVPCFLSPVSH